MDESELEEFLKSSGLPHLINKMKDEGVTLHILLQASDNELASLTTKIADRIVLRSALNDRRVQNRSADTTADNVTALITERPMSVALPERQNEIIFSLNEPFSSSSSQEVASPSTAGPSNQSQNFSFALNQEEFELLANIDFPKSSEKETINLRQLLNSDTTGKHLLTKSENNENLSPRDRACIVKLIVEKELKALKKLNNSIRKNVWLEWANEIVKLFQGESAAVYYVPYNVAGDKVVQASGLIHNRLITHRRALVSDGRKRSRSSSSSESSDSGCRSSKSVCDSDKRIRPLPDNFEASLTPDNDTSDNDLDWLKGSSAPKVTLEAKWQATFKQRNKLLASISYLEYFNTFPALVLPTGYKLLCSDFKAVYPSANDVFAENFPIVKLKILKLLAEKTDAIRVDEKITDLLELASVGEEQANVAAFFGIIYLLRQMPRVCIPRKKVWKLSREEVRSGFLGRVANAADIERYCLEREVISTSKGIPNQPFILAVGERWTDVSHYEIVIHKDLRYQLPNVVAAVRHTFHTYWALDCAYPQDSAPIWMFIQRAMFQITSKFDKDGVPLRELLSKINSM